MTRATISISDRAVDYLSQIVSDAEQRDLRIGVQNPGSSIAQCFLSFATDKSADDVVIDYQDFQLRYQKSIAEFIDDVSIDYITNRMGGTVKIKAPNMFSTEEPDDSAPLSNKVNWVLQTQINPQLAEHQGNAVLDRIEGSRVWLKFGGNCLGCGNAESTLVNFVEKMLMKKIPEIEAVSEVSRH